MEPCRRVRVAKCQMLATSFFVLLLGSAMAATAALSYFGPHFAVIGHVSADRSTYEAVHHWAFFAGIVLAALLTLGAVLSAAATVRGAGGLMAAAFLSFALVFCALAQAAFWRLHNPTQVEDAVLDAYDRAYDQVVRSASGTGRQELVAIQDTFWCCGKSSPLGLLGGSEADLCRGEEATRQDCLQGIQSFLRAHGNIVSTLIGLGLTFTGPQPPSPGAQSIQMYPGGIPISSPPVQSGRSQGPSESKRVLWSASAAPGHPPACPRERRRYGLHSHVTLVGGEALFPSMWWGAGRGGLTRPAPPFKPTGGWGSRGQPQTLGRG
ncbi:tetraspanin-32 isoform 2-T2 [Dama dama]|uniref:tetraspanin-32 isoform X2 n=1 Tax=Dama dama TaxID=30532 RepID=UPI002A36810D|nr:tetraspanin-32 isoform X2 [Dama dama]